MKKFDRQQTYLTPNNINLILVLVGGDTNV